QALAALAARLLFVHGHYVLNGFTDIAGGEGRGRLPPRRQETVDQMVGSADSLSDVREVASELARRSFVASGVLGADLVNGQVHEIQGISDLVRDGGGKASQKRGLLGLVQP